MKVGELSGFLRTMAGGWREPEAAIGSTDTRTSQARSRWPANRAWISRLAP